MKPTHAVKIPPSLAIHALFAFVISFWLTLIVRIFTSPMVAVNAGRLAFWMTAIRLMELEEKRREAD